MLAKETSKNSYQILLALSSVFDVATAVKYARLRTLRSALNANDMAVLYREVLLE